MLTEVPKPNAQAAKKEAPGGRQTRLKYVAASKQTLQLLWKDMLLLGSSPSDEIVHRRIIQKLEALARASKAHGYPEIEGVSAGVCQQFRKSAEASGTHRQHDDPTPVRLQQAVQRCRARDLAELHADVGQGAHRRENRESAHDLPPVRGTYALSLRVAYGRVCAKIPRHLPRLESRGEPRFWRFALEAVLGAATHRPRNQ